MERVSSILAAIVAGALSGAGVSYVRSRPPEIKPATADQHALADEVATLTAQVGTLEDQVARLERQRRLPTPAAGTAQPAMAKERSVADDPVFEAAVRDVLERIQQERAERRDERRTQVAQRWADQLAEKAALNDTQKASVRAIADDLAQKMRDLREADGGADPGRGWADQRNALRTQGEQRLSETLTARQMQVYRESGDLGIDQVLRGGGGRGRGGQGQ
jgi:hypothetical protein